MVSWDAMGIERLKIFVVLGPKDSSVMFSNSGLSLDVFFRNSCLAINALFTHMSQLAKLL